MVLQSESVHSVHRISSNHSQRFVAGRRSPGQGRWSHFRLRLLCSILPFAIFSSSSLSSCFSSSPPLSSFSTFFSHFCVEFWVASNSVSDQSTTLAPASQWQASTSNIIQTGIGAANSSGIARRLNASVNEDAATSDTAAAQVCVSRPSSTAASLFLLRLTEVSSPAESQPDHLIFAHRSGAYDLRHGKSVEHTPLLPTSTICPAQSPLFPFICCQTVPGAENLSSSATRDPNL